MVKEQYLVLMNDYMTLLGAQGAKAEEIVDYDKKYSDYSKTEVLNHAFFMADRIITLVNSDELDKANRWLGFLQGMLWAENIFSINDMRGQNR